MSSISRTSRKQWIEQFDPKDRDIATTALSAMRSVSANDFEKAIYYTCLRHFATLNGAIALFPEREVKKYRGRPVRFFKEDQVGPRGKKRQRAVGEAPSPIYRQRGDRIDFGSEGRVSSIIGQMSRASPDQIISNPSPNLMRKKKVRHIVLLTDFIGSGDRLLNMLESIWRIHTIRSWHSFGWIKFHVIAYAATENGVDRIEDHPAKPKVVTASMARHLAGCFAGDKKTLAAVRNLCIRYNKESVDYALGYGKSEIMMTFAHGCPNNVPAIFWSTRARWLGLFPARTTFNSPEVSPNTSDASFLSSQVEALGLHVGDLAVFGRLSLQSKKLMLLLSAMKVGARSIPEISDRSGLSIADAYELQDLALKHALVTAAYRLTDSGNATLLAVMRERVRPLDTREDAPYYPKQLRAP